MAKQSTGRPAGSTNLSREQAIGELTRCPACGSTERGPYTWKQEQAFLGLDPQGKPYTHIVKRRTHCQACGQARIDKHVENRVSSKK